MSTEQAATAGGGEKKPSPVSLDNATSTAPRIPHSRSQALASHGRLLYRASMDEEGLDLPIVLTEEGFMADRRINNVMPRKDDEKAKHAWSIPPVETFQVCLRCRRFFDTCFASSRRGFFCSMVVGVSVRTG